MGQATASQEESRAAALGWGDPGTLEKRRWQRKGVSGSRGGKETARKEQGQAWGESTRCPSSVLLHASAVRVSPPALPDPGPWLTVGTDSTSMGQCDLQATHRPKRE